MAETLDFMFKLNAVFSGSEQVQKANEGITKLQQATQNLQRQSANIQGFQKQAQKLSDLRSKLDTARAKVKNMQATMRQGGNVDPKLFTRAHQEAARLQEQVIQNTKKLGEFRAELKDAGINTSDLASAQTKLQSQTEAMTRAQEKLNSAQKKFSDLKANLSWGNIKADLLKSAAMVKTFEVPIKVNMDFEQAMAQVKAVANPTQEMFDKLVTQAKALGSSTQFSATQSANAQEVLLRAGLTPNEVLTSLGSVLDVAAAEGMSIEQAADYLINTTKAAKLDTSKMANVGDILAYTSSHSNTNIAQLSEAMAIAASGAADINVSVEQLAAILGAMSNTVRGSQAGTALDSVIKRLAKRPKQVKDALQTLGVAIQTREGNMISPVLIIKQVEDAIKRKGLGTAKAGALRAQLYGSFASQMSSLAENIDNGVFASLFEGAKNERDGAASKMALTRNNTLKGDVTSLSSAWEGLMIKIGEALTPINRFITQTLTIGIQKFTNFLDQNKELCDVAIQVGYAFAGWKILSTVLGYGKTIFQLAGAWLNVAKATSAANDAMKAAGLAGEALSGTPGIIGRITAAFGVLKAAILAHPLLALAALVAVVVTAIIMNWDKLKAWWNDWVIPNVWEPIRPYVEGTVKFVLQLCDKLKEWWDSWTIPDVWETLITSLDNAIAYVKGQWQALMDWLGKFNPFNWEMPSWLGGGKGGDNQIKNANAIADGAGYYPPSIRHAKGGIFSKPHLGLVAEAGSEAIIPLTDKSRGIPLLQKAAQSLGVSNDIQPHALGGIFSKPHLGLVAEAGSEAIIPLSNKARGVPLLFQAAQSLGLGNIFQQKQEQINPSPQSKNTLYDYAVAAAEQGKSVYDVNLPSQQAQQAQQAPKAQNSIINLAQSFGLSRIFGQDRQSLPSLTELAAPHYSANSSPNSSRNINIPAVNLTINLSGDNSQSSTDLAGTIADKVREVLADIISLDERVKFA